MSVGRKMKDWTICCCWFLLVSWRLHRETLDLGGKKSLNPRGVLKWTLLQGNYFYIWKDKMSFLAGSVFGLAWSSVRTSVKSHTHTKRCNLWPPKLVIFNRYIDLFLSILLKLSNNDTSITCRNEQNIPKVSVFSSLKFTSPSLFLECLAASTINCSSQKQRRGCWTMQWSILVSWWVFITFILSNCP